MLYNLHAIILAAGKATRFNTGNTKVIEKICGQPMILYPTRLLSSLNIDTTVVIGYQKKAVQKIITKTHAELIDFVVQEEQLGTGHALLCAQPHFKKDHILIMNADVPLINESLINNLYTKHIESQAAFSFVSAHHTDPQSRYGRVIKKDGIIEIVEAKHFNGDHNEHCCINAGIYIARKDFLDTYINTIQQTGKEFYITDLVHIASQQGLPVAMMDAPFDVVRGVNNYEELWAVEQIQRAHLIKYWMQRGVRFFAAQTAHIDLNVTIGAGTFIGTGVHLLGETTIGKYCTIEAFSYITDSLIDDQATVKSHSLIEQSHIHEHALVGPFVHVGPKATIGEGSHIGNFVEIKKSTVGKGSKAKHLSYIGDATIGNNVNIGAGAITCNYNGIAKHHTKIDHDAFIGTNTSIIAPVTIGKNAFTAAGSTITENVPNDALAIARARQINKLGYAEKIRKKNSATTISFDINEKKHESSCDTQSFIGAIKTTNDVSYPSTEE